MKFILIKPRLKVESIVTEVLDSVLSMTTVSLYASSSNHKVSIIEL